MEVLPVTKNEGAIVALTTTPVVLDLQHYHGGYVRLASLLDADTFYICALDTSVAPAVFIASTAAEGQHSTNSVPNVADIVRGGPGGTNRFIKRTTPFLWIRTVTGTATLHVKPAGRPGEGI